MGINIPGYPIQWIRDTTEVAEDIIKIEAVEKPHLEVVNGSTCPVGI